MRRELAARLLRVFNDVQVVFVLAVLVLAPRLTTISDRAVRAKNEVEAGEDNPINAGALKKKRSSIGQDEFDDACNDASQGIDALRAGDATAPPPPPTLRAPPLEAVLESVAPPVARAPGGPYFDEARRQAVIAAVAGAGSEEERVKIVRAAFARSGP